VPFGQPYGLESAKLTTGKGEVAVIKSKTPNSESIREQAAQRPTSNVEFRRIRGMLETACLQAVFPFQSGDSTV